MPELSIYSAEKCVWGGFQTASATPETQLNFDFGTLFGGASGSIVAKRIVVGFGATARARISPWRTSAPTLATSATVAGVGTDVPVITVIAGTEIEFVMPEGSREPWWGVSLKLDTASVVVSVSAFA